MQVFALSSQVSIVSEPAYGFDSADNVRAYPFALDLDSTARPVSVHGVLVDGEPLAVFGASGGATGVHEHSALLLSELLFLAVTNKIVCMRVRPFEYLWALRVDDATCFGIHFHTRTKSLLSHGELAITKFTEDGAIVWQSSGRDIFTGGFTLGEESIAVADFEGYEHHFSYSNGQRDA